MEGLSVLWTCDIASSPKSVHIWSHGVPQLTAVSQPGGTHTCTYLDYEEQPIQLNLEPPKPDAVHKALDILLASAKEANKECFESVEGFERDNPAKLSELVKVAGLALLREADTRSQDIRHKYDTKAKEYRQQRDAAKAEKAFIRNTAVPLFRLPLEVFQVILIFAYEDLLETNSQIPPLGGLQELASVSKFWRHTILSTGELWTTLNDEMPGFHVDWCFSRSKALPLDIRIENGPSERFLSRVLPLSDRWRSLEYPARPPNSLKAALSTRCSKLQNLRFLQPPSRSNPTELIQLGEGEHLRSLSLDSTALNWDSSRLRSLISLRLGCLRDHKPSMLELSSILGACRELESFTLEAMEFSISLSDEHASTDTISLPNLRILEFSRISGAGYAYLMKRLAFPFPKLRTLALEPILERSVPMYDHTSPSFIEQISMFVKSSEKITVALCPSTQAVRVGDPNGPQFRLSAVCGAEEAELLKGKTIAQQASKIIQQAFREKPLKMEFMDGDRFSLHRAIELIKGFETATEMSLANGQACAIGLLQYLAERRPNAAEQDIWPCPRLSNIDLRGAGEMEPREIHEAVKNRWVKAIVPRPRVRKSGDAPRGRIRKPIIVGQVKVSMPGSGNGEVWRPNASQLFALQADNGFTFDFLPDRADKGEGSRALKRK